jgi:hypothetical protein
MTLAYYPADNYRTTPEERDLLPVLSEKATDEQWSELGARFAAVTGSDEVRPDASAPPGATDSVDPSEADPGRAVREGEGAGRSGPLDDAQGRAGPGGRPG